MDFPISYQPCQLLFLIYDFMKAPTCQLYSPMLDPADRKHDAVIDRRERDVLEHGHRVGANDRLTVWSILFSGSIFYLKGRNFGGKEFWYDENLAGLAEYFFCSNFLPLR